MKRLPPLRTYSSLSRRAVVRIAAESEPEPGSVSAYAASHSPLARRGSHRSFCSSVPASLRASEPSSCTAMTRPLVAQTFEISSIATSAMSALAPRPPYSSSKRIPKSSCSRKSSTTSQGNSAVLSISAARGAIRSRASVRTRSRISRCSSLSGSTGTLASLVGTHGSDCEALLLVGDPRRPRLEPRACLDEDSLSVERRVVRLDPEELEIAEQKLAVEAIANPSGSVAVRLFPALLRPEGLELPPPFVEDPGRDRPRVAVSPHFELRRRVRVLAHGDVRGQHGATAEHAAEVVRPRSRVAAEVRRRSGH